VRSKHNPGSGFRSENCPPSQGFEFSNHSHRLSHLECSLEEPWRWSALEKAISGPRARQNECSPIVHPDANSFFFDSSLWNAAMKPLITIRSAPA